MAEPQKKYPHDEWLTPAIPSGRLLRDWPATPPSRLAIPLARAVMTLLCRLNAVGIGNLPAAPPYIVASNHLTYFDLIAMLSVMPPGVNTVVLAARKYKGTWKEPILRLNALIWVTQFSPDHEALRAAIKVLERGDVLGIAPEGTRSKTGGLNQGCEGVAFVATRAHVPIVPVAVWGVENILKRPRPCVTVRVGKSFCLPEGRAKGDQLREYTDRVICAIAALLPEVYHGFYAGNPLIEEMSKRVC